MKTLSDSLLARVSKRLDLAEKEIARMGRALRHCGITACACCGEYYASKDHSLMLTTKGSVCLNCIRDNEDALEGCKVSQIDLSRAFWVAYNDFMTCATVDGKRYLTGAAIDRSRGLKERENRDIAIVLWDFAESNGIELRSYSGKIPHYNPADFSPDAGVWEYRK